MKAAERSLSDVVKVLIKNGADVDVQNKVASYSAF
jgi:hypothetical protein